MNNGRAGDGFEAGNRDGALKADLAFIGHVCLDEIVPFDGQRWVAPAAPCSAELLPGQVPAQGLQS